MMIMMMITMMITAIQPHICQSLYTYEVPTKRDSYCKTWVPNALPTDSHDNTPLKIYVKPSVSFDISTKQGDDPEGDDPDQHHNDHNDHDDDNLIDGDDDHQNGDYTARQPQPVSLHGIAPSTDNLEPQPPQKQKAKKPVRFTRQKESVPTAERSHKYSLRENPIPSKKYQ